MTILIKLKNGDKLSIKNLSSIKSWDSRNANLIETKDFSTFTIFNKNYIFVGDNTLTINGSEILYVEFQNP
jgi:hypothetical protein